MKMNEFIIETRQSGGDVNVREGRSRTSRSRDFRATLVSLFEFDHNVGACDVTCVSPCMEEGRKDASPYCGGASRRGS